MAAGVHVEIPDMDVAFAIYWKVRHANLIVRLIRQFRDRDAGRPPRLIADLGDERTGNTTRCTTRGFAPNPLSPLADVALSPPGEN